MKSSAQEQSKNSFRQNIKIKEDKEKTRLLNLQEEFSLGKIKEEDISEADIQKLHKLYDEQIEELNKSTENYKKRILEIRASLKR